MDDQNVGPDWPGGLGSAQTDTNPPDTKPHIVLDKKTHTKFGLSWPPGNKEWLIIGILIVVLAAGASWLILSHASKSAPSTNLKRTTKPKPKTVASMLSGLQVDPAVNDRPVTAIMIENSQDARPQSGLSQANVVFEAIAEGGITRFLALYQDNIPDNVGPIRSSRPYYIQWELGFDAGYAHVGGSPEALADIKAWGVRDLDQFHNAGAYHRISSRAAPHNVYSSLPSLIGLSASKGYTNSTFTSLERTKKKPVPSKQPTAKSINLTLSGALYNVHYDYNAATNSYNRSEAGAPHIDANTNAQLSPNVVVALVVPYGIKSDGYHSDYQVIGSGPVYIFQDGLVTTGQWTKTNERTQLFFTDAAGKHLALDPGQTWFTAVSDISKVSYAP